MGIGRVHIVGAGAGAADLITVRGLKTLHQADVVICDSLLPQSFLADLGVSTRDKSVWLLKPGDTRDRQAQISKLMCDAAKDGQVVVRLKGGDPLVFGRASAELDALAAQGIPWEIIPGPSSCTAALSAAGLAPTWRKNGSSFAVATARRAGGAVNESYPRADSLVIFMGAAVIEQVAEQLLRDGWQPATPTAVLERATLPWEHRVAGPLCEIAAAARKAGIASPALLVVGAAAAQRHAFSQRPMVLFTGLDPFGFRTLGDILHWPALQLVRNTAGYAALPQIIDKLDRRGFDWIGFTSRAGAKLFFEAVRGLRLDGRLLAGMKLVAAGPGTALELRQQGLWADAVADRPGGDGMLSAMDHLAGAGVLLVQGANAPTTLTDALGLRGARVTRLALHSVIPHPELGRPLPMHDVIYFTSPSGVRAVWDAYGDVAFGRDVWCIGAVTLAKLEKLGIQAKVVSPHVSQDENAKVQAV